MKIVFLTTQTQEGSTVVGRVLPLACHLAETNTVHVLVHGQPTKSEGDVELHGFGQDPFARTAQGKQRLTGLALIVRMKLNALAAFSKLWALKPDIVVIVKSLPENTLAAWWYSWFRSSTILLDADDFELTANKLTSVMQRMAVHASARVAAKVANKIIVASPFLEDYYHQLAPTKSITIIPTGINEFTYSHTKNDSIRLLYIGSVSISSGHRVDMLPQIFEKVRRLIPSATLTIAGSGDDVEKLQKEFMELGLREHVSFTGRFSSSDIPSLLSNTDIVLDPIDDSIVNRAKSTSRVLVALCAGLPVVSSNIGIRAQLVPVIFHEAFFAKPGDVESYADKIISMIRNPLSAQDAEELQNSARPYLWANLAKSYQALWKS